MDNEHLLHERVQVIATFQNGLSLCVPRKIRRANGREITVTELGMRHPTYAGAKTVHIFDVTDGQSEYRLEFDSERLVWHLTREAMYE